MFIRSPHNPLITPQDIIPSRPDFEVIGAFNAGVTRYKSETILLIRIAERPIAQEQGVLLCPHLADNGEMSVLRVRLDDSDWDMSDSRKLRHLASGVVYLTSISHLRLARSSNGIDFTIEPQPWLSPATEYERFGIEDCRITQIGDTYYVNYSAVSIYGIGTALVSTRDFVHIERHGLIFAPANRNICIFPEQIGGNYICYHRPMPGMFGSLDIWIARSPDLIHWGRFDRVINSQSKGWQSGRVGGGAPPIKTSEGWLSIYHAADANDTYSLGAFLTPLDNPEQIIARSQTPILFPEAPYETKGFFRNVLFTCGMVVMDGDIYLYYGAADERIALAQSSVDSLISHLSK